MDIDMYKFLKLFQSSELRDMSYQSNWKIPARYRKIHGLDGSEYIVGIKVSKDPLFQIVVTNTKDRIYLHVCKEREDFKQMLALNNILSTDKDTVDQVLGQFFAIQEAISSESLFISLVKEQLLEIRFKEFHFSVRLHELTSNDDKLPIMEQLMHKFADFSLLQSMILMKNQAEIDNKNQIIMKLLINQIHNSSTVMGLESNHELTEDEIYNHEVVNSVLLRNSGLRKSLSSTASQIRQRTIENYKENEEDYSHNSLNTLFNREFDPQWSVLSGGAFSSHVNSDASYTRVATSSNRRKMAKMEIKQETERRNEDKTPTMSTFQYLLSRKRKRRGNNNSSIKYPKR
ncbi:hypothetical protein FOA43_004299 [Brettanomyces nanus]|uniref:Uncharacterized protein n=1 Tax=Eeniella nana TaxID=13502 RepID=A0A875S9W6_EENNA|nr:uncharacterized protein FOA43_004299 [Brettanomyces nanus]QPG76905.1 hypothetical protein FOA43_004299 [Brettanomyces nanus]